MKPESTFRKVIAGPGRLAAIILPFRISVKVAAVLLIVILVLAIGRLWGAFPTPAVVPPADPVLCVAFWDGTTLRLSADPNDSRAALDALYETQIRPRIEAQIRVALGKARVVVE